MKKITTIIVLALFLVSGIISPATGQKAFSAPDQQSQNIQQKEEIENFKLYGNFPNPVRDKTYFKFELKSSKQVEIRLFDLLGNKKRAISEKVYEKGIHEVEMDVSGLEEGVYFYKFYVDGNTITKRLNIVKH